MGIAFTNYNYLYYVGPLTNDGNPELIALKKIISLVLEKEVEINAIDAKYEADCKKKGNGWAWINNNECINKPMPGCWTNPPWKYPNWGECPSRSGGVQV